MSTGTAEAIAARASWNSRSPVPADDRIIPDAEPAAGARTSVRTPYGMMGAPREVTVRSVRSTRATRLRGSGA
jgi:hypothetical protein